MKKFTIKGAWWVGAMFLLCAGCQRYETPTQATPPSAQAPPQASSPSSPQTLVLGEVVDITLDTTIGNGGDACEVGNDPAPCVRFVIDVPRAGALVIRMEFETAQPMFIYLYMYDSGVPGRVIDLQNVRSDQSPLVARQAVEPGLVDLHAGLNVPWGLRGQQMRFRLGATLE